MLLMRFPPMAIRLFYICNLVKFGKKSVCEGRPVV